MEETEGPGEKPPLNPKSLATFSLAQAGIRTQAVVRDSVQSVAVQGFYVIIFLFLHIFVLISSNSLIHHQGSQYMDEVDVY